MVAISTAIPRELILIIALLFRTLMKSYFSKTIGIERKSHGFTLIELLIAALITSVVILVAGNGLISIMTANQQAEADSQRRMDLNRALDYISDDIREASSVSTTVPSGTPWTGWAAPSNCYSGVLYLTKPNATLGGTPVAVAYYTRPKTCGTGVVWQSPQIIYRSTTSGDEGNALVDAIASSSPPNCSTGSGTASSGTVGFKVWVQNSRSVKLCLLGQLVGSDTFAVNSQAFARAK